MKYTPSQTPIPPTHRKILNEKVLYLIDHGNPTESGISQEDIFNAYTGDGGLNILFSPKAPKWFGWKALSVTAATGVEDSIVITLGVQYESGTIFGKLGDAANYKNQLHTIEMTGLVNYTEEHLKKW